VWQAYDPALQKDVAVKVPRTRRSTHTHSQTAFLNEARKAASLRHPAIVQVYDVGASEHGWYIVSEFIEGTSLRTRLEAGSLPFEQAARIVATVAGALHAAHLAGLVHRDVKSANILLDRDGNAYLTDFGLAIGEDELPGERYKISGTLAYMPPEQIRGDTHLMDGRADVYSLGAVLYELLTGRLPFRAEAYDEYLELILRREPRPPRSIAAVPEDLERICLKCLAKEVKDRYRTAQDLAADLETWLTGSPRTDASAPAAPVPRWVKPAVVSAIAVSVVAAIVCVVALGSFRDGSGSVSTQPGPGKEPFSGVTGKVPTVKELLWFKKGGSKWEVLPDTSELKVYSESTALLQLGETNADTWDFTATLRQPITKGGVGLFLGYRIDPQTRIADFELISLVAFPKGIEIQLTLQTYRTDAPFVGTTERMWNSVPLKGQQSENTFRLMVRDGRLREVRLNGEVIANFVKGPVNPPAAGAFGVFTQNSDGIYSKLRFNGITIPLLTEATPPTSERP
jgi:serine/threonine protein kinase